MANTIWRDIPLHGSAKPSARPSSVVDEVSCLVSLPFAVFLPARSPRAPSRPSRFKRFNQPSKPPRMTRISRMPRMGFLHPRDPRNPWSHRIENNRNDTAFDCFRPEPRGGTPRPPAFAEPSAGRPATMPSGSCRGAILRRGRGILPRRCRPRPTLPDRSLRETSRPSRFKISPPPEQTTTDGTDFTDDADPVFSSVFIRVHPWLHRLEHNRDDSAFDCFRPSHEAGSLVHPPSPSLRRAGPQPCHRTSRPRSHPPPWTGHPASSQCRPRSTYPPDIFAHLRALRGSVCSTTRANHHGWHGFHGWRGSSTFIRVHPRPSVVAPASVANGR